MSRIYLRLAFLARRAPAILWSDAVAGLEPETVVQLLGDHDLAAHAQLDGSRCFGLCFHISVSYNWREHRSTVRSVATRSVATMLPRLGSTRGDSRRLEGTTAWLEREDRQRLIAKDLT